MLVVDDDLDMLHLIGLRLSTAGYEVNTADSGESALASFRLHRPQMVITDLRMGEMDGLMLFDHLEDVDTPDDLNSDTIPRISATILGARPRLGSSSSRRRGRLIRARPSASI